MSNRQYIGKTVSVVELAELVSGDSMASVHGDRATATGSSGGMKTVSYTGTLHDIQGDLVHVRCDFGERVGGPRDGRRIVEMRVVNTKSPAFIRINVHL